MKPRELRELREGYTLIVKFKSNCNGKSNGCMTKGVAVREYLTMLYDEWRKKVGY